MVFIHRAERSGIWSGPDRIPLLLERHGALTFHDVMSIRRISLGCLTIASLSYIGACADDPELRDRGQETSDDDVENSDTSETGHSPDDTSDEDATGSYPPDSSTDTSAGTTHGSPGDTNDGVTTDEDSTPTLKPEVKLSYDSAAFYLRWEAVPGAHHYRVRSTQDGTSFKTVQSDITRTRLRMEVAVHDYDWPDLVVDACDASESVCLTSDTVEMDERHSVMATGTHTNSFPLAYDRVSLGKTVAVSGAGNRLAIAAPYTGSSYKDYYGEILIYGRDSTNDWRMTTRFHPKRSVKGLRFGEQMAFSQDGQVLVVGAPREPNSEGGINSPVTPNDLSPSAGAVYVFIRESAGEWKQQAYIKAAAPKENDRCGVSLGVSSDGNTIVAGCKTGHHMVFRRSGTTWRASGTFETGTPSSLALSGDGSSVAVGMADGNKVAFYKIEGDSATPKGEVSITHKMDQKFGQKVAMSRDGLGLAVTAPGDTSDALGVTNGSHPNEAGSEDGRCYGAVYTYRRAAPNREDWSFESYLKCPDDKYLKRDFAESVSMNADGSTVVVGWPGSCVKATGVNGRDVGSEYNLGQAVVYKRAADSSWSSFAQLFSPEPKKDTYFGTSVSINDDGKKILVGAPGAWDHGYGYLF